MNLRNNRLSQPYAATHMSELSAKMRTNAALRRIIHRNDAETCKIVETTLKGFIDSRRQILIEKGKRLEDARKRCAQATQRIGSNQTLTRDQWKNLLENKYNEANQIFRGGYTGPAITDHRVAGERIREEDKNMQEYFVASEAIEPLVKELELLETKLTQEVYAERRRLYSIEYDKLEWILYNL